MKQTDLLEDVALEISCHSDEKIKQMAEDADNKVQAMRDVIKQYKKLIVSAESGMKKDCAV